MITIQVPALTYLRLTCHRCKEDERITLTKFGECLEKDYSWSNDTPDPPGKVRVFSYQCTACDRLYGVPHEGKGIRRV